jgi:hypothetical protein
MEGMVHPEWITPNCLKKAVCIQGTKYRILVDRLRKRGDMRRLRDHSTVRANALARGLIDRLERCDRPGESGVVTACRREERRNA